MGVNAAGLLCKLESFEALLQVERPSVFCVQETKVRKKNMIKLSPLEIMKFMNC